MALVPCINKDQLFLFLYIFRYDYQIYTGSGLWIILSTDNQNVKTNLSRIVALHFNTLLQLVHVLFNYDVEENMLAIILSKLKNFMLYRF